MRTYDLADADRIAVLLTRDFGVVRLVAKGAKRLRSRFGSGLEPWTSVRAEYFRKENQELGSLNRADVVESSFSFAANPEFLTRFSYLTDVLLALLPPEDPNEKIFRMVKAAINSSAIEMGNLAAIGLYFEIWLLRLSGFLPDWSRCASCSGQLDGEQTARLTADLHLLCEKCQRTFNAETVSAADRSVVELTRRLGPAEFAAQCEEKQANRLSSIFRRMIASATGRDDLNRTLTTGAALVR